MNFNLQLGSFSLSIGKSLSPASAGWLRGDDVTDGGGARLDYPYSQSAWIYDCVNILATNVAGIPFRISRVGSKARRIRMLRNSSEPAHRDFCRRALNESIIESGDVVDLFERPHPTMGRSLFWEQLTSWDALRGEFFVMPLDESDSPVNLSDRAPLVKRMITLPTELFWHVVYGYELQQWRYTGSPLLTPIPSCSLNPHEVIHARNVNPYNYWRGLSPLTVASVAAQSDYAAGKFMQGLMMNNADTGIILESDHPLSKEQLDQALAQLKERKRKAGTPDRPMALSGLRVAKPTISNVDMEFLNNRKWSREEIFSIWQVPPSVAGFTDGKKELGGGGGVGIATEKLTFIEQTITPKCRRYESALAPIVKTFGDDLIGWFDIDGLPVMQEARRARAETATKYFAMGVPFKDINLSFDLGFPDHPWHAKGYLPFSVQEAGAEEAPLPAEGVEDESEKEKDEKSNPFARMLKLLQPAPVVSKPKSELPDSFFPACCCHGGEMTEQRGRSKQEIALWKEHAAKRKVVIKQFEAKFNKVLFEARAETLRKIEEKYAPRVGASVKAAAADLTFDKTSFGDKLWAAMRQVAAQALDTAGKELLAEVGKDDPWKFPPQEALEFLAKRENKMRDVSEGVWNRINAQIAEGITDGDSIADMAKRIKGEFNDISDGRARVIASTETSAAYGASRQKAMEDVGIGYKKWLTSGLANVRSAHADANGQIVPVNEPFFVGGESLNNPGDESGSPENVINCHCVAVASKEP